MSKTIRVDILDKYDLVEKYNDKQVAHELINYLVNEAKYIPKKEDIVIEITSRFQNPRGCENLIIEGLKREYELSMKIHRKIDAKQWMFFFWGIASLALSTFLSNAILKELLVISAWVPIWEMLDLEIYMDNDERQKRKILKRLINSEIIDD